MVETAALPAPVLPVAGVNVPQPDRGHREVHRVVGGRKARDGRDSGAQHNSACAAATVVVLGVTVTVLTGSLIDDAGNRSGRS